ncbi:hypothetical protein [Harryflintia acetispora]|uniref:hypothetical protein n=1 Tax=Harryflintia acetispora TaxID=1849041 RepID=UPI00189C287B|nr:hypothetical protein [Harryflintia acetispora]
MNDNHNHDNRYYTEEEIDTKLENKINVGELKRYTVQYVQGINARAGYESYYSKTDNNTVVFCLTCERTDGTDFPDKETVTIATFPVGFRPAKSFYLPCVLHNAGGGITYPGYLTIYSNGTISSIPFRNMTTGYNKISGFGTFQAV